MLEGQCWKNARFGQWNYSLNGEILYIVNVNVDLQGSTCRAKKRVLGMRLYTLTNSDTILYLSRVNTWED